MNSKGQAIYQTWCLGVLVVNPSPDKPSQGNPNGIIRVIQGNPTKSKVNIF